MFRTTFSAPGGNQIIAIEMESTRLRAEGKSEYPRLIFPCQLTLDPVPSPTKDQPRCFFLLGGQGFLSLSGHPDKIADSLNNLTPVRIGYGGYPVQHGLEFPLDHKRIRLIEEMRTGDITFTLSLRYDVGFYDTFVPPGQPAGTPRDVITELYSTRGELRVDVPQSHWVKNILPALGDGENFLIEMPSGERNVKDAWDLLDEAETCFRNWNADGAYSKCRQLGHLMQSKIEARFGKDSFITAERWGRAYKKFDHMASLALHLEDLKAKSSKYPAAEVKVAKTDVEHLLIMTKALLKYGQDLLALQEK